MFKYRSVSVSVKAFLWSCEESFRFPCISCSYAQYVIQSSFREVAAEGFASSHNLSLTGTFGTENLILFAG